MGGGRSGSELLNETREALHLAIVGTIHAQRHAADVLVGRQQMKPKVTSVCVLGSRGLCQVSPGRVVEVVEEIVRGGPSAGSPHFCRKRVRGKCCCRDSSVSSRHQDAGRGW